MTPMKRLVSPETARRILVLGWFAAFFCNLAMLLYLYVDNWIEQENLKNALYQLNALYAPYLGAILAFYFTTRQKPPESGAAAGMAFTLAAAGSLIWNFVILILVARVFFLLGRIEPALKDMLFFGSTLSWLIAPAIGFYFANPSTPQRTGQIHEG
jgi:hypothetical protein